MDKLVSVIIPMYNAEKYIERCLQSLLNQTYKNIEIIVVNDGSVDKSPLVVEDLAKNDGRIRLLSKVNEGVSKARNYGMEKAEGEYIVFVDADDYVKEKYVENLYVAINSKENVELAVSGYYFVYKDEKKVSVNENQTCKQKDTLFYLFANGFFPCWGKMYKRKIICENHLKFDTNVAYAEDVLFLTDYVLKMRGVMEVISNKDYYYDTTHESATNSTFSERKLEIIKVYFQIRQKVSDYEQARLSIESAMFSYVEKYYFEMYKGKEWEKHRRELRVFLRSEMKNVKKNPNLSRKSKIILWMTAFRGDALVYFIKKLRKNV